MSVLLWALVSASFCTWKIYAIDPVALKADGILQGHNDARALLRAAAYLNWEPKAQEMNDLVSDGNSNKVATNDNKIKADNDVKANSNNNEKPVEKPSTEKALIKPAAVSPVTVKKSEKSDATPVTISHDDNTSDNDDVGDADVDIGFAIDPTLLEVMSVLSVLSLQCLVCILGLCVGFLSGFCAFRTNLFKKALGNPEHEYGPLQVQVQNNDKEDV
mmetsp:Transcript_4620/g.7675  ORF Transcript_4620/g.7675 Transcript_4620/m.7675 type:complete len:217 (+) Transcript_4620:34-684(+)